MGMFSSKKKTHVNTSVSRMVDDADIIPSSKIAVLDYTLGQNSASTRLSSESLPNYLIRAGSNNIVARSRKARNYAKKPTFAYGLPKSNLVSRADIDIQAAVQDSLERVYPQGVIVHDAYFGPMNNFYFLKPVLWQKYDYNYDTNELVSESARIGFKCYMESAVIKYSKHTTDALIDPDTLRQNGLSAEAGYTPFRQANRFAKHVPWVSDYEGDNDMAEVTVVYADASGAKQTYKLTFNYLAYEPSSKPIDTGLDESDATRIDPTAVAPTIEDTLQDKDYFQANYSYTQDGETKDNTFIYMYGSGLDPALDKLFDLDDQFGSHIPRIYARMDGGACNDKALKDTPEYKSMVGLCRQLGMNWSEWVNEIHKSVGALEDVTQIFMTYSLPANTNDPLIQEYMFEYFMGMYGRIPKKFATSLFSNLSSDMLSFGSKQGQTIIISDKAYTQKISFSSIGYIDRIGVIGKVGTVSSGHESYIVSTKRTTFLLKASSVAGYHYYRKQLTANTYREVRVYGLTSTEYVRGGNTTTASRESENLLIPLDLAVDHEFNGRQKEQLYTKAMYIVLNTLKVVKSKWYQTGIFKAIMFVVAVVIGYFFPPAGVPAMSWLAAAYAVVVSVAINIVISFAVKLLVSLDIDVGVAAAIVAVVALVVGGYSALTKTGTAAGVTTVQLLKIASTAFSVSSQGYALQTQKAIKDFNGLITDLTAEQKEIQEKAKELGMGQHGPLLMFEPPLSIGVKVGESPDDYYDRSIRINNLAGTIYSLTESSVDLALMLPTTQQTLSHIQEKLDELSVLGV